MLAKRKQSAHVICLSTESQRRRSRNSFQRCPCVSGGTGSWNCWFSWREENRRTSEKNPRSKDETNNKQKHNTHTASTLGAGTRTKRNSTHIWWRRRESNGATSMGGELTLHTVPSMFLLPSTFSFAFILSPTQRNIIWPTQPDLHKQSKRSILTFLV